MNRMVLAACICFHIVSISANPTETVSSMKRIERISAQSFSEMQYQLEVLRQGEMKSRPWEVGGIWILVLAFAMGIQYAATENGCTPT